MARGLGASVRVLLMVLSVGVLTGCGYFQGLVPPPPLRVDATVDEFADHIRVTWSDVRGAGAYELWRASSAEGEYSFLIRTGRLSHDDFSVIPGQDYWYKVRACGRFGCGEFSPPVLGRAKERERVPSAPADLQATQGTYGDHISVTWSEVEGVAYYEVYRARGEPAGFVLLSAVEATQYDDYDIEPGVTYWYKVRACNGGACSVLSDPVSGYAGPMGLPAPEGISATDGDYFDKIVVTWEAVEGASGYVVYRAENEDGSFEPRAEVEETTYEDTEVLPGVSYWYRVRACNADACGPLSQADEGKAGGPPLPPQGNP